MVEAGRRVPGLDFVRRCDQVFATTGKGGSLIMGWECPLTGPPARGGSSGSLWGEFSG